MVETVLSGLSVAGALNLSSIGRPGVAVSLDSAMRWLGVAGTLDSTGRTLSTDSGLRVVITYDASVSRLGIARGLLAV